MGLTGGTLQLHREGATRFGRGWWWYCSVILVQAQLISIIAWSGSGGGVDGASLPIVKIGALVAMNSTLGVVAYNAMQLAIADINADASILPTRELYLDAVDSACSAFQGAAAAVELLKDEVVAVAGPQTSTVAQFVVALGGATQVPMVSFSATDPSLTRANNPFFLRTVHNSQVTMACIASVIQLYGWKEVASLATNDYVGVDSSDALSEALYDLDIHLLSRTVISPTSNAAVLTRVLKSFALLEARVFVMLLQPSLGRLLFSIAQSLNMMTTGYVWIISEAMASQLKDLPATDPLWGSVQGALAIRSHIPPSPELDSFLKRLNTRMAQNSSTAEIPVTLYGYYAYDTVWMIARAIQTFVELGHNFTFEPRGSVGGSAMGSNDLASLRVLQEGPLLMQTLKATRVDGISGEIQVDVNGDLVGASYEVLNLVGKSARVVGYWNGGLGFSRQPAAVVNTTANVSSSYNTVAAQDPSVLEDVIWPGGSSVVPRGWAVVKNGESLQIGVPVKAGFPDFVSVHTDSANITTFSGFCIDVFEAAVTYLPYLLNYTYIAFGNGTMNPNYDDLVGGVADKEFDAAVGDVTVTMERSKIVDFTQPYTTSGLVVVVPTKPAGGGHAWAFMRPFTPLMWVTTGLFFLSTGLAIWILEHKKNKDFRGKPKKQFVTVLWFIFSTLFFAQREKTKSTLGRAVLIIWLFVVLIVISSYTASLTSILTVEQLTPTIQGIAGLVQSDLKIGYQGGSFVENYLLQLNVPANRLVPLDDQVAYANALSEGTVGAIVDELPYIQVFLASDCQFTIAGQEFTKSGWGFAFPLGSQLAVDISTAILQMAENGKLQQIHDYWLSNQNCGSTTGSSVSSNELGLDTFWGLFLITGAASIFCVLIYYARLILQHHRKYKDDDTESDRSIPRSARRKSFVLSLVRYIEESAVKDPRGDSIQDGNSSRRNGRGSKGLDLSMESVGESARSEDPSDLAETLESNGISR